MQLSPTCSVLVTYCDQWVCPSSPNARLRVSISHLQYLSNSNDCQAFTTPEMLGIHIGNLLKAMVDQGILPANGSPKPCGPENNDCIYEIMTTPCAEAWEWSGDVNGQRMMGMAVWNFCEGTVICSRRWQICLDATGQTVKQLVSSVLIDNQGNSVPGPTECTGSSSFGARSGSFEGVGALTGTTITIGNTDNNRYIYCAPVCGE